MSDPPESHDPATPPGPIRFGRFAVGPALGSGTFGLVHRAEDPLRAGPVALKLPWPRVALDPRLRTWFLREADALARLDSPLIIRFLESGSVGPIRYLVTELFEGPSLADWIETLGRAVPAALAAEVARLLAVAISHIHARGLVHRDLNPANVLIASDCSAHPEAVTALKVVDFGLARFCDGSGEDPDENRRLGTPPYMAPEQLAPRPPPAEPAADTYAVGAILHELLTGRPPFPGATADEILESQARHPIDLRAFRTDIPPELDAVCRRCLDPDPGQRFHSSAALAETLRDVVRSIAPPAVTRQ